MNNYGSSDLIPVFLKGLIIALLGFFVVFLLNGYVARLLGPSAFGDFSVAISLAILCGHVINMGGSRAINKFYAIYKSENDFSSLLGYLRFFGGFILASGFILAALVFLSGYIVFYFFNSKIGGGLHPLFIALFLSPFYGLLDLTLSLYACSGHIVWAVAPKRFLMPALSMLLIWLFSLFFEKMSSWSVTGLSIVSTMCVLLLIILMLKPVTHIDFKGIEPCFNKQRWLKVSLSTMTDPLIVLAIAQASLVMLEIFFHDEKMVGFFSAAFWVTFIYEIILNTFTALFSPLIGQSVLQGREAIVKQLSIVFVFLIPTLFFLSLPFCLLSKIILLYFGNGFDGAFLILIILSVANIFRLLAFPFKSCLFFSGNQVFVVFINILTFLLVIALNLYLIPRYGGEGAALSTLLAYGCSMLFLVFYYLRYLNE